MRIYPYWAKTLTNRPKLPSPALTHFSISPRRPSLLHPHTDNWGPCLSPADRACMGCSVSLSRGPLASGSHRLRARTYLSRLRVGPTPLRQSLSHRHAGPRCRIYPYPGVRDAIAPRTLRCPTWQNLRRWSQGGARFLQRTMAPTRAIYWNLEHYLDHLRVAGRHLTECEENTMFRQRCHALNPRSVPLDGQEGVWGDLHPVRIAHG
jgi:hypothetical protein